MKILFIAILLAFIFIPQITASTVSLIPQPVCSSAKIFDISCPDIIRNRIVPIGTHRCEITAIIGRCTLKNNSETIYSYPTCQLNELGNLSNVFSGIVYNESTILPNGDKQEVYHSLFN